MLKSRIRLHDEKTCDWEKDHFPHPKLTKNLFNQIIRASSKLNEYNPINLHFFTLSRHKLNINQDKIKQHRKYSIVISTLWFWKISGKNQMTEAGIWLILHTIIPKKIEYMWWNVKRSREFKWKLTGPPRAVKPASSTSSKMPSSPITYTYITKAWKWGVYIILSTNMATSSNNNYNK